MKEKEHNLNKENENNEEKNEEKEHNLKKEKENNEEKNEGKRT